MYTHAVDTAPPPSPQIRSSPTMNPDVNPQDPPEGAPEIEARSDAEASPGEISGRDRRAGVYLLGSHPLHAWIDPLKAVCREDCKSMSLEELKALAERRECLRSIEASSVYTRDEMAGFNSASVEDLRDAKEKARFVLQLSQPSQVNQNMEIHSRHNYKWDWANYLGNVGVHIVLGEASFPGTSVLLAY